MRSVCLVLILTSVLRTTGFSQDNKDTWFDFWVGRWAATWTEPDGKTGRGTNTVVKILDNSVIEENFRIDAGSSEGYLGKSLSVYNPKRETWHQGYADNEGSYFDFNGERQGDKRIFRTDLVTKADKQIILRMVFYDIEQNSFTWDWESTEDGGKTWKLNWRIYYQRIIE